MSGYEKYVEQVADEITYHPGNRTGTPESRHAVSVMLAHAVLAAVGPLIEEDTRDRMVTAAAASLDRDGGAEQAIRAKVAEEIAEALVQCRELHWTHRELAARIAREIGGTP